MTRPGPAFGVAEAQTEAGAIFHRTSIRGGDRLFATVPNDREEFSVFLRNQRQRGIAIVEDLEQPCRVLLPALVGYALSPRSSSKCCRPVACHGLTPRTLLEELTCLMHYGARGTHEVSSADRRRGERLSSCPLTLPLKVLQNPVLKPEAGTMQIYLVQRGVLQLSVDARIQIATAGSLFATVRGAEVTSSAAGSNWLAAELAPTLLHDDLESLPVEESSLSESAAMDYWLIQPVVEASFVYLVPPAPRFEAFVRSVSAAQQVLASRSSVYWRCFARSHIFDLLQGLRRELETSLAEPRMAELEPNDWVAAVLLYLNEELPRQPSLEGTARHLGLNRDAFAKRVKLESGRTFHDLVSDLRLRKAEWLVRQTQLPMLEIAAQVGLRDQTHFTRLFKSHYSSTPLRYRARMSKSR